MKRAKMVVWIGQGLLFLNALLWLVVGIAGIFLIDPNSKAPFWVLVIISVGMIVYGAILVLLGFLLRLRRRLYYFTAVILLVISILLPLFDDFGLADMIAVVPAICALIYLLFKKRFLIDTELHKPASG